MSDLKAQHDNSNSIQNAEAIDRLADQFEAEWKQGARPGLEEYLRRVPLSQQDLLLRELLAVEFEFRLRLGEAPTADGYVERFPNSEAVVRRALRSVQWPSAKPQDAVEERWRLDTVDEASPKPCQEDYASHIIGRYLVVQHLGSGSFGSVYRCRDPHLNRDVAVKVSRRREDNSERPASVEAITLAKFDHPNIVPVHDVGQTDDGRFYIVSKFVDGNDLSKVIESGPMSPIDAAGLAATIARALQHAHSRGFVHRDIKPENILIDRNGTPYLADFSIALADRDAASGPEFAGTPAYMSPEQSTGKSSAVDGRSDIFSLGIVLFELLTGKLPFAGETRDDLLRQISSCHAKPIRQFDPTLPKELERICGLALAKDVRERYACAADFADELSQFIQIANAGRNPSVRQAPDDDNVLHAIWDSLDENLQYAFSLAYNKKRREGKNRISTRDLFQSLVRVGDEFFGRLAESLPSGALPGAVDASVRPDGSVLRDSPLLSDCIEESLTRFRKSGPAPRRITCADVFVDIGKHGHGPSVVQLRQHGVTAKVLDEQVRKVGLDVLRPKAK